MQGLFKKPIIWLIGQLVSAQLLLAQDATPSPLATCDVPAPITCTPACDTPAKSPPTCAPACDTPAKCPPTCAPACEAPAKCPPKPCNKRVKKCKPKQPEKGCPHPAPPTKVCPEEPCCPPWPSPVLNAAYNYPARTLIRSPCDMFFDASFLYWQPTQDNMLLGILNSTVFDESNFANGINSRGINIDFGFRPGFRVGAGGYFDHDNWEMHAEYTWFHCHQKKRASTESGQQILPSWGFPYSISTQAYYSAKERWNLKMDIGDMELARLCYVGTELTFRPNFGLRSAWIRQDVAVQYDRPEAINGQDPDAAVIKGKSNSWAVGPKVGLDANWLIGAGFRLFGCTGADLLFTNYTCLLFKETHTGLIQNNPVKVKMSRISAVKPHLDLEVGLGWGTYLDCHSWYLDFALGYEFQIFFDQNMFLHFNDNGNAGNNTFPNGNLSIQGFSGSAKLDF